MPSAILFGEARPHFQLLNQHLFFCGFMMLTQHGRDEGITCLYASIASPIISQEETDSDLYFSNNSRAWYKTSTRSVCDMLGEQIKCIKSAVDVLPRIALQRLTEVWSDVLSVSAKDKRKTFTWTGNVRLQDALRQRVNCCLRKQQWRRNGA